MRIKSEYFCCRFRANLPVTVENWHPNMPLLQTVGGRRFWLGSATFIFIDGRQVILNLCEGNTYGEVLKETMEIIRELPAPKMDDLKFDLLD